MSGSGRSSCAWAVWLLGGFLVAEGFALVAVDPPDSATTAQFLERRRKFQESKPPLSFHDFKLTESQERSGITFVHRIVDDAGRNYKAAHYDHGNGLAVADVDGDGLPDIYFTTQLGKNQLWHNLGRGKFEDWTERAGVALLDQISVGASFGDFDNDGLPDLFVSTVRHGNHLFKNLGRGSFQDVTKEIGVAHSGHSSGALFFDYDNDGWLDLLVMNVGGYTIEEKGPGGYYLARADAFSGHLFPERAELKILYRNAGGKKFENVSEKAGLRDGSWSGDATFADLNSDGYPDLYFPNMQGDDRYYENQKGQAFMERTAQFFPKTPWGAMGAKFFDFNRDGLLDLFITDMHSDMTQKQTEESLGFQPVLEKRKSEAWCSVQWTEEYLQGSSNNIFGNAFYENKGAGKFEEVSDRLGVETYWPWGMSVGDVNADGYEDIFVTAGMGYPFRYAMNSLLLNENGRRFADSEFLLGVEPRRPGRLYREWFKLDCSGADKTNELCTGRSGVISVPGVMSSRSSAFVDLDGDGDLDLVTLDLNGPPQVFLSDLSDKRQIHYLKVKLVGKASNRDGLGAAVTLKAGGRIWFQYHDGKSGYLGQSSLPLYFGLGEVAMVDSLEVKWPSGNVQKIGSVRANQMLTVKEERRD